MSKVRTCLWFDGTALEAAELYVSLLPESRIETMFRANPDSPPMVVNFVLCGVPYQGLNGGPMFKHTEAASICVVTADQAETDRLWAALISNGGMESRCGWLKDRFGLSWQIVPEALPQLMMHPDREAARRVQSALMTMAKIEIASLEAAFQGI